MMMIAVAGMIMTTTTVVAINHRIFGLNHTLITNNTMINGAAYRRSIFLPKSLLI